MTDQEELIRTSMVKTFKPINTILPIVVQLAVITAIEISTIVLVFDQPNHGTKCKPYFVVLYLHGAHWFVALIIDHIVKYEHYSLRMNGYMEFYRKTINHHRLPFYVVSLWTASLFILQTIMQHSYLDNMEKQCLRQDLHTPLSYFCAVVSLEFIVLGMINVSYIWKVCQFNHMQPVPDVQKEEWAFTSTQSMFVSQELGYGIQQCRLQDLLEKQADMIQYLREHNDRMNKKLMLSNVQQSSQDAVSS